MNSFSLVLFCSEDTGMMSTLFIGPQDYVFDLKEHAQLLTGIGIGFALAGVLLKIVATRKKSYSPVAMNELKSKAMD